MQETEEFFQLAEGSIHTLQVFGMGLLLKGVKAYIDGSERHEY